MIIKTIWTRIDRALCKCKCDFCGEEFIRTRAKTVRGKHHFCSLNCRTEYWKNHQKEWDKINKKRSEALKGSKSYLWNGGKRFYSGYIAIYKPEHLHCNKAGYVMEHRVVIEKHIGRYLNPEEVVHHVNGVVDDNRIENLILFSTDAEHQRYHKKMRLGLV